MKFSKNTFFALLAIVAMTFACNEDEEVDDKGGIGCQEAAGQNGAVAELQKVTDANEAYMSDASAANCMAYATAIENYIDYVANIECDDANFKQAIDVYKSTASTYEGILSSVKATCGE